VETKSCEKEWIVGIPSADGMGWNWFRVKAESYVMNVGGNGAGNTTCKLEMYDVDINVQRTDPLPGPIHTFVAPFVSLVSAANFIPPDPTGPVKPVPKHAH
jgi:hypothetical protein